MWAWFVCGSVCITYVIHWCINDKCMLNIACCVAFIATSIGVGTIEGLIEGLLKDNIEELGIFRNSYHAWYQLFSFLADSWKKFMKKAKHDIFISVSMHYASEKLNFEVISRCTFEWLWRFSEGPKCQTYQILVLESRNWPKMSSYH